ncbi:hypothetical protein Tco_1029181 [Tanacetum coccineum]|uniref:Uncharacterized protein n=1 Tax=Tanacetum coccineum TaxID=301880 RepID=A0ABQ5G318_9ASTR
MDYFDITRGSCVLAIKMQKCVPVYNKADMWQATEACKELLWIEKDGDAIEDDIMIVVMPQEVGSLWMYAMSCTRPQDLAHAVEVVSTFLCQILVRSIGKLLNGYFDICEGELFHGKQDWQKCVVPTPPPTPPFRTTEADMRTQGKRAKETIVVEKVFAKTCFKQQRYAVLFNTDDNASRNVDENAVAREIEELLLCCAEMVPTPSS